MLNNIFFPQENNQYPLGDFCHQQTQAAVPAWVLTDMQGNILLANYAANDYVSEWLVTGGRITINRFFQSCTAMIVCSAQVINQNNLYPNLPTKVARAVTSKVTNRQGTYSSWSTELKYPLTKNDEVAIWCGYVGNPRRVEPKDLGVNLIRRFVGVIDTIACAGTSTQGVNLIIQCRDRTRYLMDSMGTFNSTDFNPLYNQSNSQGSTADIAKEESTVGGAKYKIKRKDVILEMARRSIGHLGGADSIKAYKDSCDSVGGMRILEGYIKDYGDINVADPNSGQTIDDVYNPLNSSSTQFGYGIAPGQVPFLGGSTRTDKIRIEQPDLVFNILTGRLPYQIQSENQSWLGNNQTVTDRVPAEFIKYLSLQEPWPTEFFCDSRTGEYWYAPRGVDTSGLADPKRFFRTYVFRKAPDGLLNTLLTDSVTSDAARQRLANSQELGDYTSLNSGKAIDDVNRAVTTGSALTIGNGYQVPAEVMQKLAPLAGLDTNKDDDVELPFINLNQKLSTGTTLLEELSFLNVSGGLADIKRALINRRIAFLDTADPTKAVGSLLPEGDNAIHACQAALLFREESSIINWRSNIIVSNQGTAESSTQSAVHIKLNPSWLQGRNFACSYFNVVDQTVGSNISELVALAMSFARIYGKELRAATMHVLGDPSITPGEIVQVIGSPLHPDVYLESSKEYWKTERINFSAYSDGYQALNNKLMEMKNDDPRNEKNSVPLPAKAVTPENLANPKEHIPAQASGINAKSTIELTQAQLMCPASFGAPETAASASSSPGLGATTIVPNSTTTSTQVTPGNQATLPVDSNTLNTVTFPQDPQSMWRVEAIVEKFNEQPGSGYKTEIALLSPF